MAAPLCHCQPEIQTQSHSGPDPSMGETEMRLLVEVVVCMHYSLLLLGRWNRERRRHESQCPWSI